MKERRKKWNKTSPADTEHTLKEICLQRLSSCNGYKPFGESLMFDATHVFTTAPLKLHALAETKL